MPRILFIAFLFISLFAQAQSNPAIAEQRIAAAAAAFEGQDFAQAAQLFREIVALEPQNALAWHFLGQSLAKLGDKEGAKQAYGRVLEIQPTGEVADRTSQFMIYLSPPEADDSQWVSDQKGCKVFIKDTYRVVATQGLTWSGSCVDGFAEGNGELTLRTNHGATRTYIGSVVSGYIHGKGRYTLINPDGSVVYDYVGNFMWGEQTGSGIKKWGASKGSTYEGEFLNGELHGYGKETCCNGSSYEGTYVNGKYHGKGLKSYGYGSLYEVEYVHGEVISSKKIK